MSPERPISSLALNRLAVYLRCLRRLQELGTQRISSKQLADRFDLSAPQIRKDLAQVGEFGIRGVGYDVGHLRERLEAVFHLHREHPTVIVGAGNIGRALARFPGFARGGFRIVGVFDNDPDKIGEPLLDLTIQPSDELAETVRREGAEIAILSVPAAAAQATFDQLVAAGIRGVVNFAPVQLKGPSHVQVKTVDLMIPMEELAFFLG